MLVEDDLHMLENQLTGFISDLPSSSSSKAGNSSLTQIAQGQSKYVQLLGVIEEIGKELRPAYAGSRSSAERLKRGLVLARILVRECLIETERSARQ